MLGGFVGRTLLLAFGYAYPAFRCFRTVEKNWVGIEELRFWCQYWIIMALVTVMERFADILISCLLQRVETGVGRLFMAPEVLVLYWQYVAEMGQAVFLQALPYLAAHSQQLPQINTSPVTKKQDSMRRPSPKELSTLRSARFNRTGQMKRSVSGFPGSNTQTTNFVYVEGHKLEEAYVMKCIIVPVPTSIKVGASDAGKDDTNNNLVDSKDDGKLDSDRQRQRSHISEIRQRRVAAV